MCGWYLKTQDLFNVEWFPSLEVQAQGERGVRRDDALILWHTELITQLLYTL